MKLPDGPRTPSWLQTIQLISRPLESLDKLQELYGDAFTLGDKKTPSVYLSHPQAIKEVFTAEQNLLDTSQGKKKVLEPFLGKHSILLTKSESHKRLRRLLMPPFHGERIRVYGQLICDITEQVMATWRTDQFFYVRSAMQEITLRVMLQAVFGLHQGERYEQIRQLVSVFLDTLSSPSKTILLVIPALRWNLGTWSPWGQFVYLRQEIDRLLYSEIQERRRSLDSERTDILTLLLMARDENGQPLTDEELRDQLMSLLIGGHETTSTILTWALYWIHYLPKIESKLLHELNRKGALVDSSAIAKLPYLNAVCQETLRLNPVGLAFSQEVQAPMQIMDYQFDPGTMLLICTYLTHQREDLYPEPKQFKPERFLEREFSPYEFLPFGGGKHMCIGMTFAQFEMKLILATILSRWQLALVDPRPLKPVSNGPTIAPPKSFQMVVKAQAAMRSDQEQFV